VNLKKPSKSNLKKKCDIAWSKLIKDRAGNRCQICGSVSSLNSHHIIGRVNHVLRWDLKNGICLCASCHKFSTNSAHNNPLAFMEWYKSTYPDNYEYLRSKRNETVKLTLGYYEQIYQELKEVSNA